MFVVLFFLVACVHGSSAVFSYPTEARVAEHMELPWHVVLLKDATKSTYGGVVASRFYVLTVCKRYSVFRKLHPGEITYSNIRVVAGSISVKPYEFQGAQVRWIYYWEDHPRCRKGGDSGYRVFDISVVKVTQMFIFNAYLKPMPFERDQAKMKKIVDGWIRSNKTCTFAGFGGYRFEHIQFMGHYYPPIYTPNTPDSDDKKKGIIGYDCCISKLLRVIEMTLVDYEECKRIPNYLHNFNNIYMQDPPIDAFCAIGKGAPGNETTMNRAGMVCNLDFGAPIECKRDEGDRKGEYLVIGHASYASRCDILSAERPQVFTRYDWVLHEWISQFWNDEPYGDHWIDAEYNTPIEFCNDTVYSGPIPPEDIS